MKVRNSEKEGMAEKNVVQLPQSMSYFIGGSQCPFIHFNFSILRFKAVQQIIMISCIVSAHLVSSIITKDHESCVCDIYIMLCIVCLLTVFRKDVGITI